MDKSAQDEIEWMLARDPAFGDSSAILLRRDQFYRLALAKLAGSVASLHRLWPNVESLPLRGLRALVRDPLLRLAIHDALRVVAGRTTDLSAIERLDALLRRNSDVLARATTTPLEESMPRLTYIRHSDAAVWTGVREGSQHGNDFCMQFEDECLPNRLIGTVSDGQLVPCDEVMGTALNAALSRLGELMPMLGSEVLQHVSIVSFATVRTVGARMESGSVRTIPGAVFLSPEIADDQTKLAEALFHEAVHGRLFDLYISTGLLSASYAALQSRRIEVPWNRTTSLQTNEWPLDQALAALHVYVHLWLLGARLSSETADGSARGDEICERAVYRSKFLISKVREIGEGCLNSRGWLFISWLDEIICRASSVNSHRAVPRRSSFERYADGMPGGFAWSNTNEIVLVSEAGSRTLDAYLSGELEIDDHSSLVTTGIVARETSDGKEV